MTNWMQRKPGSVATGTFLALATLVLAGCSGLQMHETGVGPGSPTVVTLMQGIVHGGQQAVTGATIQLYSVGTTGYGSAATPLLPTSGASVVTSDASGSFTLPSYTCSSNSYVYLTATGGNPQVAGSANPDIALMAALGSCATLQANAATTFIFMDEVTTVAAVWALQQFITITPGAPLSSAPGGSGATPSFTVGTSATNMQGLINAFGIAQILANTTTGASPGTNTSGTQSNVESWQVNTIADILASCINSDPVGGSPRCSSLFTAAQAGNTPAPADTLQAAWTMAQNPGKNVQNLFALSTPSAPFQPVDNFVNDWTIGIAIVPSATYGTFLGSPYWIAFDSYGNAWVTSTNNGASAGFVTEFDPQGNVISKITNYNLGSSGAPTLTTIGTEATGRPFDVAIDPANNAWINDRTGGAIFRIAGSSSAGGANGGGGAAAYGISTGSGSLPSAMAVDGNGTVWSTLQGSTYNSNFAATNNQGLAGIAPSLPVNSGTTGPLSGGFMSGNPGATSTSSYALAVDATPTSTYASAPFVEVVNNQVTCSSLKYGNMNSYFAGLGATTGSTTTTQAETTPANIIADSGVACAAVGAGLSAVSTTYAGATYNVPALYTPMGVAVDGFNNTWVLNTAIVSAPTGYPALGLTKLTPTYSTSANGALVASYIPTVTTGGGLPTFATPQFIAIDGANNIWVTTQATTSPAPLSSFAEFKNDGTPLSPNAATQIQSAGRTANGWYGGNTGTSTGRISQSRRGLAIDLSGNVWTVNNASAGKEISILVGAGVPTVTPLSLALQTGKLGTRP